MKKLLVLPLMLSLVSIIGNSPVEAKGWRSGSGSSSEFLNRPKRNRPKKCNLCQPRPPKKCNLCQDRPVNFGTPMPKGGNHFNFGTPMPRGGFQPNTGTHWR